MCRQADNSASIEGRSRVFGDGFCGTNNDSGRLTVDTGVKL